VRVAALVGISRAPHLQHDAERASDCTDSLWPLVLAIVLGMLLRLYRLGANSFWYDEIATLSLANHSPTEILRLSSTTNFIPPLYFLVIHWVVQLFGQSELTVRLPSALAGIASIPVGWLLIKDISGSRSTAHAASLLLAVNPLHLWYSQEGRPYALLLLFGSCALFGLERALRSEALQYWAMFAVCSALAFFTHTTGVLFVLIGWTWLLASPPRRHLWPALLAASLTAALLCLPSVLAVRDALATTHGTFHSLPRALTGLELPYTLFTYVGGYSFGPAPREIQNFGARVALQQHPIETAIGTGLWIAVLAGLWLKRQPSLIPFIALLALPVLGIFLLSAVSGKAYNVRYTLPAVIGFIGIIAIEAHSLRPGVRLLYLGTLLGVSAWADAQWFVEARYWKEDSRGAVAWLRHNLQPGTAVAVAPDYTTEPLRYYARLAGAELRFVPLPFEAHLRVDSLPAALVLSRLHHVPSWRQLRSTFLESPRSGVVRGDVPGYQMLIRTPIDIPVR
jgi:mannosyltransferase